MTAPRVLVSIHDVTPAWRDEVEGLWRLCGAAGVVPALLVVPDWHGRWPLAAHRGLVKWLHARVADGAELLLHGLRHDEAGLGRGWRDGLRAAGRTAREGEFLTLGRVAARTRVLERLRALRTLDLELTGFVPPAWAMRPVCVDALADAGLPLAEDADAVFVLRAAPRRRVVRLRAPAWRWSTRA